jgi:putative glutamine amidotransferase
MPRAHHRNLRIGLSSCFMHADPLRPIFKGKTLLYQVEPMSDWLMSQGAMCYLIPSIPRDSPVSLRDYVSDLDALILQGGADLAPQSYGEEPLQPEWAGDAVRDAYEMALVREFHAQKKPILGICRGLQLLNAAFGGTLYQDINTQVAHSLVHRDWEIYDQNVHEIAIAAGSYFEQIYGSPRSLTVNSVHYQAIKSLASCFQIEARSVPDGIIEAIKFVGDGYIIGVQWHPEFQGPHDQVPLLPTEPLLLSFLNEAKRRLVIEQGV